MPLAAGTRLGVYEVLGLIGAGGMGEVYRARDPKLNRDVALKVLPDVFVNDPERLARFQREAQVLAALNHSNIAHIYGLEEATLSGPAEAGHYRQHALVMELVEGEDLAQRIARGPIPLEDALPIARQIAEALEAAHEQGIIHRDLKPANIKVRPDGMVKVLDFGLAKALSPDVGRDLSPAGATHSPTITSPALMTGAGMILGTAAYMSPEQARGKPLDRRTDIWAFGCVLYEMLTGRRAFAGDDVTDTIAAIVRADPDWAALPPNVPTPIRRLLRRALAKDRQERLSDIADARLEINEALTAPAETPVAAARPVAKSRERLAWIIAALLAVAVAGAVAVPYVRTPAAAPETRLEVSTPATSDLISFAISPDGQRLVFVASDEGQPRLWLRPLDAVTAQPLAGTEGASYPFWAPDSRSVGFFAAGKLKRADIGGGLPQTLADAAPRGGAWSTDGVIIFAPQGAGPLFRIAASGGEVVAVTKLDKQTSHRFPSFLPGGRQFLFYALGTPDMGGIFLGSLDAPETTRLTAAGTAGVYAPPGWLLFVRQGTLVARRFDVARGILSDDPVTVADPVIVDAGLAGSRALSVSATGLVAYRTGTSQRQLVWFDRSGKPLGTMGPPDTTLSTVNLSPDENRAAVHRRVANNTDVWLFERERAMRFTSDPSNDQFPIWSPDGRWIAFDSNRDGGIRNLYRKPSNSAEREELLVASMESKAASDWSDDGRFILYSSFDATSGLPDVWVLPFEAGAKPGKPFVFLPTDFDDRTSQFSPNGHWVAYQSTESGKWEVYVRPFPGPGGQSLVSTAGGIQPRWSADGKELYYVSPDGTLMAAAIGLNGTALDVGSPAALFQTRIWGGGANSTVRQQYDVARDGRFLINVVTDETAPPIVVIQNWSGLEK